MAVVESSEEVEDKVHRDRFAPQKWQRERGEAEQREEVSENEGRYGWRAGVSTKAGKTGGRACRKARARKAGRDAGDCEGREQHSEPGGGRREIAIGRGAGDRHGRIERERSALADSTAPATARAWRPEDNVLDLCSPPPKFPNYYISSGTHFRSLLSRMKGWSSSSPWPLRPSTVRANFQLQIPNVVEARPLSPPCVAKVLFMP